MRHSGIRKISNKQERELILRGKLRMELADKYGESCMTCGGKNKDWRGISLSHIIPLSRGGKTSEENCLLECYPDHELYEKHPERRPLWQQEQAGLIGGK